jgi:tripartite-type tricarboxylate transporter receptor subunit TctC
LVVRGPADGSTLLVVDPLALVANPYVYKTVPYVWQRDLKPVAALADVDLFMFCSAKAPFKTVQEVVQYAKRNPGKLNFGTTANASVEHLSVERLKAHAGIEVTRIPYNGMGQIVPALITGEIDIFIFGPLPFLGQIREGTIRALVAGSAQRSSVLPQIPTLADAGLPADLFIGTTFTLFAASQVPERIIQDISRWSEGIVASPRFKEKFAVRGLTARFEKPLGVSARLQDADQRLGALIKSLQIAPQG